MFLGCSELKSLDLSKLNTSKVEYMYAMFNGCSKLVSLNLSNFKTSNVKDMSIMFNGCCSLSSLDLSNFNLSEVIVMNGIFNDCTKLENIIVNSNTKSLKAFPEYDIICSTSNLMIPKWNFFFINCNNNFKFFCYKYISNHNILGSKCELCGTNYFQIYNYPPFIYNCSKNITEEPDSHINDISNEINKYNISYDEYIIDSQSNNLLLILTKIENLINECDMKKENKSNICEISLDKETNNQDINNIILNEILSGSMNKIIEQMNKNNSNNLTIAIKEEKTSHFISSMSYMMKNSDISSINFQECGELLKLNYSLNSIEDLIIYKIEHYIDEFKIPILEYSLFLYNRDNDNITKINLDICKDMNIIYYLPIKINGNDINMYNPNSELYNDECLTYKSEYGVDMSLYDRQNSFNINYMSLCEKGCTYLKYDFNKSRVECLCKIKTSLTFGENNINIDDLLSKIEAKKKSANIIVTFCDMSVCTANIVSNFASYILLSILLIFIIIFVIFCTKGYQVLENKIDEIIYKKFKNKEKNENNINRILKITKKRGSSRGKTIMKKRDSTILNNSKKTLKTKNINSIITNDEHIKSNNKNNKDKNDFHADTDYELNWLSYKDALKQDKRANCDYYCSLIKSKQLFFFTFCSFDDYNSGIIKKFIFFLSFALHYTINALFFNDNTMHQIILDKGEYNFSYQLPQILYSSIISIFILRLVLHII